MDQIVLKIDPMWVTYASLAINICFALGYILNKARMERFLAGRWKGELITDGKSKCRYICTLIITTHHTRENSAILYYRRESVGSGGTSTRGIDKMTNYSPNIFFILNKEWKPEFRRYLHVRYDLENHGEQIDDDFTVNYTWSCQVINIWRKPKLSIQISGNEMDFKGTFHKE